RNRWAVWNTLTAERVVSGDSTCSCTQRADIAGSVFVLQTQTGLEVRSATAGQVVSTIAAPIAWWKLASDGSYVTAGSATGLTPWSPRGTSLLSKSGDYSQAVVYAAPAEIRIAKGAAGTDVIE